MTNDLMGYFWIGVGNLASEGKRSNRKGLILAGAAIVALAGLFIYDVFFNIPEYTKSDFSMGTVVTQTLTGNDAEKAAGEIFEAFDNIEQKWLSWRLPNANIAKVNEAAGTGFPVADNTVEWLKKTLDVCASSSGALDITIGRITALWDFGGEYERLPKKDEISDMLGKVDYRGVEFTGNTVKIARGQSLDMGAVGKGIACDEALKILRENDIKSAIISVGGSILLYGGKEDFRVGIRDPEGRPTDYMGVLTLKSGCISTSGSYEKTLVRDGGTYHHILDPKTGYSAQSGLTSVTVVCDSGLLTDALSTACFVLGYENSLPLLEKYNAHAVFIADDRSVKVTPGLAGLFEIANNDYTSDSSLTSTGAVQ
ncbi:MAG: FAD:protein FMN transferase [Clostridiales bacterium]|nr:FAD:protein FMN transferase [Clostridiales bacterium]